MATRRTFAWGGIVGPAGFIGAWALGGLLTDGYSPVNDAISQLAAVGADERALMSAGFACFGAAVPLFGLALREELSGPAWKAAVATGLATLGVGLLPLEASDSIDLAHGVAATLGYVTLAATPLLAARPLAALGYRRAAVASIAAGVVAGACLAATAFTSSRHGLLQRTGLTVGDAWLAAAGIWILRRRD